MNMKKLLFFIALAGTLGGFAASTDSYILWMVDKTATGTERGGASIDGKSYTAKVVALDSNTSWTDQADGKNYLTLYSIDNTGTQIDGYTGVSVGIRSAVSGIQNLQYFANVAGYTGGYTYFVELWNEGGVVARSEGLPYEQASIAALADISTPGTLWAPKTFVAAPEPNSALLLLIGCATLALRRRKQIVA